MNFEWKIQRELIEVSEEMEEIASELKIASEFLATKRWDYLVKYPFGFYPEQEITFPKKETIHSHIDFNAV